jgi:hypothetical protein
LQDKKKHLPDNFLAQIALRITFRKNAIAGLQIRASVLIGGDSIGLVVHYNEHTFVIDLELY